MKIEAQIPTTLKAMHNTMKIHQLVLHSPGIFSSLCVSCLCGYPETIMCNCYQPVPVIPMLAEKDDSNHEQQSVYEDLQSHASEKYQLTTTHTEMEARDSVFIKIDTIDETLISQYCVVTYEERPYPGIIVDVDDEEIEVNVMHCIGKNHYFWPMMDDVLWYKPSQVVTLLANPPQREQAPTNR